VAYLETRLSEVAEGIKINRNDLVPALVDQITDYVDKTNQWLADTRNNLQSVTIAEFDDKISGLERICTPARLNKIILIS